MAATTAYLVSLILLQQAVTCTSIVTRHGHGTQKSGLNHVNGMSKTKVLSESMMVKSTRQSKQSSTIPPYNADAFWGLILGLGKHSSYGTRPKSHPTGLNKLQIVTKSSTFMPGLSFLKAEKKSVKSDKIVRRELKSIESTTESSKLIKGKVHRKGEHIAKRKRTEAKESKTIRFSNKDIEQVIAGLKHQPYVPTTLPPLETTSGYNALLTTNIGAILGMNLRLLNSIEKQSKAMKVESKYEMTNKPNIHATDLFMTDPSIYHHEEHEKVKSLPDTLEKTIRAIQNPNYVANTKPTSKVKQHIDSQPSVHRKSKSDHQPYLGIGDVQASNRIVKSHNMQMNHPASSNNGHFIIKQRTVDFIDPYLLEQQMLEKENQRTSKSKPKASSLLMNSLEPKVRLDPVNTKRDSQLSRSNSIPQRMSGKEKTNKDHGGQGKGWQGYDKQGHSGSRANSESHYNDFQHQIPFHTEKNFVERKDFSVKQTHHSSNNSVEPFANKLDARVNHQGPSVSGQLGGNHRRPYNLVNSAHELLQSLITNQNQDKSARHSWTYPSTTASPPTERMPQSQQLAGHTGQQQQNDQQGEKQIEQLQWNVNQIIQNLQSGDLTHLQQGKDPYQNYQQLSEHKSQTKPNGEQNGHREQQDPQSNSNGQRNTGENQDTAWQQPNVYYDAIADQYLADSTYNNDFIEPDTNYQPPFEQDTQQAYQGEPYDTQIYPDQQPQTNFQIPPGWNIYSDVESQDLAADPRQPYTIELQEVSVMTNHDDDSDEKR